MSYKPFASLALVDGELKTTSIPSQIRYGSWFLLTNIQIRNLNNPSIHFASTTRSSLHNRRVILAEEPTALPRLLKVRVRSTSERNAHRSYPHQDHDHFHDFPDCCCTDDKKRPANVSKERWTVESNNFTIGTFCCTEPEESTLWSCL